MGFTLRRHLTDEHIASLHFSTNLNNARFVQTAQLIFAQVGNVARNFFSAQLGIASNHREFFNVDRSVTVVGNNTFADQHRIFVVITIPRHEGDQHVLAEGQFSDISRSAVSKHITLSNVVTLHDNRTLVNVRRLVRARELLKRVNINTSFASNAFFVVHTNHNTIGVNIVNNATTTSLNGRLRVHCHRTFNACTHNRFFWTQARHALTLHVRTHQSTVRVIVFQERNQSGSARNDLSWRHVHVLDAIGASQNGFPIVTSRDQLLSQTPVFIHFSVSLSNEVTTFFNSGQIHNFLRSDAIDHLTVWGFQETVFVKASIKSQRVDQTNVRTFRRFNRAHTTIVSRMHVTHFKARAFTSQTTWTQSRNTTLVRNFRKRVGLVHKLGQLA